MMNYDLEIEDEINPFFCELLSVRIFITTEGKPGQYKTVLPFHCMSFYQFFGKM